MTDIAIMPMRPSWPCALRRIAAIALFLGLPLALAAVSGFAVVAGVEARRDARRAETAAHALLHRLDSRPTATRADTAALSLASTSPGMARAELQALANRLAEAAGVRIIEMRAADEAAGSAADDRVALAITFQASNAGLLEFLYAAETGLPLLTVPDIDVRSEPGDDGRRSADLQVTLTLVGRLRPAAP